MTHHVNNRGDATKNLKIVEDGVTVSMASYQDVRIFLYAGKRLVQKYSTKAEDIAADYKECTKNAEDVEFNIYREDWKEFRGGEEVNLQVLLSISNGDFLDNVYVDAYKTRLGDVDGMFDETVSDGL